MRHELKYLVDVDDAETVRKVVRHFCPLDKHGLDRPSQAYTVRSIYFDSPQAAIFTHKVEGLHTRVKVRVRGYNDVDPESIVGLELKRKRADLSWKTRAHARLDRTASWLASTAAADERVSLFEPAELEAADYFHYVVNRYTLRPVCLVVYEREAYVGHHDPSLRITFDMNLRGKFVGSLLDLGDSCPYPVFNRHFILEVKFDHHRPSWIRPVLAELGLTRRALSKYVFVMDRVARAERRTTDQVFSRLRSAGLGRVAFTV